MYPKDGHQGGCQGQECSLASERSGMGPWKDAGTLTLRLHLWTPLSCLFTLSRFGPESLYLLSGSQDDLGLFHNPGATLQASLELDVTFSPNSTFQEGQVSGCGLVRCPPAPSPQFPTPGAEQKCCWGQQCALKAPSPKESLF